MDKRLENLRKNPNGLGIPKFQKRKSRWTLLFVDDHGKVISLGHFKRVVTVSTVIVAFVVAITGGLYFLYRSNAQEKKRLQTALEASQQKVNVLRDEKDQMMVRLVLAEAKIGAGQLEIKKEKIDAQSDVSQGLSAAATTKPKTAADQSVGQAAVKLPVAEPVSVADTATATPDTRAASMPAEDSQVVDVEKLVVLYETDTHRLRVSFILRKTDPNTESVVGRAFVVLKPDQIDQKQWLTIPSVALAGGKPSRVHRGQYFSIARFKPMKFERKVKDPRRFQYLSVFIFTKEGKLLLEKELTIETQNTLSQPADQKKEEG
jgi:hypothetical protein